MGRLHGAGQARDANIGRRRSAHRPALEPEQREYRLGWRLALADGSPTAFEIGLEGTRRGFARPPEHALGLRMTGRS